MNRALKATLEHLALLHPTGILVCGENTISGESFCKPINLAKAKLKLLSCSRIEIKSLEYFVEVTSRIMKWMKDNISLPSNRAWWQMASPSAWLKYNFSSDLYIIHLSVAHTHYYICVRDEYLRYFRKKAYG